MGYKKNIYNTGEDVGVGTITPTVKLDIDGKVRSTDLQIDTTIVPIVDQVWTAVDTSGNGEWKTSPSGVTDHTLLTNIGTNTHAQIDTHIADGTIHFTQAAISIPASQISDFDVEVSNNSSVTSNSLFRTTPSTEITAGVNLSWAGNTLNATALTPTLQAVTTAGSTTTDDIQAGSVTAYTSANQYSKIDKSGFVRAQVTSSYSVQMTASLGEIKVRFNSAFDTDLQFPTATQNNVATLQNGSGTIAFLSDITGGSSPLTTKGDLYTYSTVDTRLPVGTNGQVLEVDSTQATGLKWVAGFVPYTGASSNVDLNAKNLTNINELGVTTNTTLSSGEDIMVNMVVDNDQSGTADFTALRITIDNTGNTSSGENNFIKVGIDGTEALLVRSNGSFILGQGASHSYINASQTHLSGQLKMPSSGLISNDGTGGVNLSGNGGTYLTTVNKNNDIVTITGANDPVTATSNQTRYCTVLGRGFEDTTVSSNFRTVGLELRSVVDLDPKTGASYHTSLRIAPTINDTGKAHLAIESLSGDIKFTGADVTMGNVLHISPSATPGSATAGDIYYDSTSNKLRCYNGTIWNNLF